MDIHIPGIQLDCIPSSLWMVSTSSGTQSKQRDRRVWDARFLLVENLLTSVNLVNGTMGIVEDIDWEPRSEGADTRVKPPDVIVVRFHL